MYKQKKTQSDIKIHNQTILDDLSEFLEKKGIESHTWLDCWGYWGLLVGRTRAYYVECDSIYSHRKWVVSLADPQYREKCQIHILANVYKRRV